MGNTYKRLLVPPPNQSFFLLGPRGTGKSTWLKENFSQALVINLLKSEQFLAYQSQPGLLAQKCKGLPKKSCVVIDEIQKIPELLDEVQSIMFEQENAIQFALTGSSSRKLKRTNANLLAGRAIQKKFFPLTSDELQDDFDLEAILRYGSLPLALQPKDASEKIEFLSAYVETYLKEEIQQEALTRKLDQFFRFLKVSAIANAQITNWSNIARDVGISRSTVTGYFEILIETLVGWILPAFQAQAKIKEVSHPKFYWFDTGVLRTLNGSIHDPIEKQERGILFETWVCNEVRALNSLLGWGSELSYWRTEAGNEVDLILKRGKRAIGIEIKSTQKWKSEYNSGLHVLLEEKKIQKALGVYLGEHTLVDPASVKVIPYRELSKELSNFFS